MSFQCHGPALRTDITFAGASIHVGLTCFSSPTVGAGRFDTYAESASARTSLALPQGQTATPPACCKFSLPHPGKFAGSRDPLSIRWLIDSILPAHDSHRLVIAIGFIFASYEGRAVLNSFGGYLTFRATQRTALALRMFSCDISTRSRRLLRPHSGWRIALSVRGPIDEISYFGSDLLPSILRTAIAAGVTLSALTVLSPHLTLVVIPLVPAFLAVRHRYRRRIGRQADLVQAAEVNSAVSCRSISRP